MIGQALNLRERLSEKLNSITHSFKSQRNTNSRETEIIENIRQRRARPHSSNLEVLKIRKDEGALHEFFGFDGNTDATNTLLNRESLQTSLNDILPPSSALEAQTRKVISTGEERRLRVKILDDITEVLKNSIPTNNSQSELPSLASLATTIRAWASTESDCLVDCEIVYEPICANNATTYSNECEMNKSICMFGDIVHHYRYGLCETISEILTGGIEEVASECDFECEEKEDIVCGSNRKTYANVCKLEKDSCEHGTDLSIFHRGPCAQQLFPFNARYICDIECPDTLNMVCSTDGYTYDNRCELYKHACRVDIHVAELHAGPCVNNQTPLLPAGKCYVPCSKEWQPVCGSDGHTYRNECVFERSVCQGAPITLLRRGKCSYSSSVDNNLSPL